MIQEFTFENYKAFEKGAVRIKPITILLGANSVGKSSILQFILMLQQTTFTNSNYKSALRLHGKYVSLGESSNLFRKKDYSKPLCFSFTFENRDLKATINKILMNDILEGAYSFARLLAIENNKSNKNSINHLLKSMTNNNWLEKEKFNETIANLLEGINQFRNKNRDTYDLLEKSNLLGLGNFKKVKINSENKEEYLETYSLLYDINQQIKDNKCKIAFELGNSTQEFLYIKKVTLHISNTEIMSVEFINNDKINFVCNYVDSKKIVKLSAKLHHIFNKEATVFSFINENLENANTQSIFVSTVKNVFSIFSRGFLDAFKEDSVNYVSPLRAHPKRYYFLDKANISNYLDTLDGDELTEVLKENTKIKEQVNTWLKKFNLQVDVSLLQDIIHKLVINQNSLSLDITDVGFGISQILPVIIQGFLSNKASVTLIEQPEIHLHPTMQADLADLFIDIAITKDKSKYTVNKYLLIETHSEYLLKRLRRRISEGIIKAEDVAIYLIDPQTETNGAIIRELKIQEKGAFDWPVDFYGGELLKDTTEFLKNQ